jgi:hypothetical protein
MFPLSKLQNILEDRNRGAEPVSYYIHSIPGRLRIKTPFLKGNPQLAEKLRDLIPNGPEVHSTTVNTLTGSLTVLYNPFHL